MRYLLDTNVVFEWTKARPDSGVSTWLAQADEDGLFLSVMTLAELRHGVERLTPGARRRRLDGWLSRDLPERFEGRILPIDATVADAWGAVVARRAASGRPIGVCDAFIAATAAVHGLAVVSRNVRDFRHAAEVLNPWKG